MMDKMSKVFHEAAGNVGGAIKSMPHKVRGMLADNQRKMVLAKREMNKRYPAGWAQNSFHMEEVNKIMKKIK